MPSALENFIRLSQTAGMSLADLTQLAHAADSAIRELSTEIAGLNSNLQAAEGKQAKLNQRLQEATAVGSKVTPSKIETLKTASANQDKIIADLKSQLQVKEAGRTAVAALSPSPAILKAKDDLPRLIEQYKALAEAKAAATRADDPARLNELGIRMADQRKQIQATTRALEEYVTSLRGVQQQTTSGTPGRYPQITPQQEPVISAAEQKKLDAEVKAQQELQRLRSTLGQERYRDINAAAKEAGYGPQNVKRIASMGLEGIEKISYVKTGADGVQRSLDLLMDKSGKVLPTVSRQFSTFASSVGRDLRELTKWTIAISLIYGPMRKMQEIMGLMVENEVKLATAMIAVSESTMKMGDVFDAANAAANAMGENVSDVIVNFSEAYQATGGLGDAMSRTKTATILMNDALTLSKLSSLSATQSIDTLASALRQSSSTFKEGVNPLEQGSSLLDKWVRTTKIANVSMDTLATGFSVLGEAANAAGLSDTELNAVLAVTAETMGVTGREAANMARSFVAGFQSDKAIAALEAVGISTKNAQGEMRTLLQLQADLYSAKSAGVISDDVYSKLTLAIGGGTRRQAAVAGFIEQYPRINQIVEGQAGAEGEAAKALARQLDTVQTSLTRLQNAFQSLAQSLGNEGGLLDIFKAIVDVLGGIVTVADKAFEAMGKAGPILALALGAGQVMKAQGPVWAKTTAASIGNSIGGTLGPGAGQYVQNVLLGKRLYENQFVRRELPLSRGEYFGRIGGSALLAGALPAIENFSRAARGEDRYGNAKGVANITGAVGGAIVGSIVAGSPLIGASVGSAIAETFVTSATRELSGAAIKGIVITPTGGKEATVGESTRERLAGPGVWGGIKQFIAEQTAGGIASQAAASYARRRPEGSAPLTLETTESILYGYLSKAGKAAFDKWYSDQIATGAVTPAPSRRAFEEDILTQKDTKGTYIQTIRKQREQEYLTDLIQGKMTPTAYTQKMQEMGTFAEKATRYYAAFGEELLNVSDDINTTEDAYAAFLDVFSYGSADQLTTITTMVTEISDLTNKIQNLKDVSGGEIINAAAIKEAETRIKELQGILANSMKVMAEQAQIEKYPVPKLINMNKPIVGSMGALQNIYTRAKTAEEQFYTSPGLGEAAKTETEVATMRQSFEDFSVGIEQGGKIVYYSISELAKIFTGSADKIGQDWFQKMLDEAILSGEINVKVDVKEPTWGGKIDVSSSQKGLIDAWIGYAESMMAGQGLKLDRNEVQVVQYEDGQWGQLVGDNRAVQYALSQIQETEQKQLEQGIWNIPEGATFMVPITSLTAANQAQTGGGKSLQGPPPYEPLESEGAANGEEAAAAAAMRQRYEEAAKGYVVPAFLKKYMERRAEDMRENPSILDKYSGLIGSTPLDRQDAMENQILSYKPDIGNFTLPESRTQPAKEPTDFFKDLWNNLLGDAANNLLPRGTSKVPQDMWPNLLDTLRSLKASVGEKASTMVENLPTLPKISLALNSTTTLTLDGRVLATAMKPYFLADITRAISALGRNRAQTAV